MILLSGTAQLRRIYEPKFPFTHAKYYQGVRCLEQLRLFFGMRERGRNDMNTLLLETCNELDASLN